MAGIYRSVGQIMPSSSVLWPSLNNQGICEEGKPGKISDYNHNEVTFNFSCVLKGWICISWDGGIIRK